MPTEKIARTLEDAVLPHLDAGYNLARWLTRNAEARKMWSTKRVCVRGDVPRACAAGIVVLGYLRSCVTPAIHGSSRIVT